MICFDFETHAIEPRPHYPPRPVGVAIRIPGKKSKYWAFGHAAGGNNCTEEQARAALAEVWHHPLLAYNTAFDYAVATEAWGLPAKPWNEMHDALYLAFLDSPHARTLELKPTAERVLQMPPDERDAVRDWLVDHKIIARNDKKWGAHICDAPGDLVGQYACGDTERAYQLYKTLLPSIKERGMLAAYDRERELFPILLANEQQGLRVDVEKLGNDIDDYARQLEHVERWIRKYLKAPGLNLDADQDVADALERAGEVTEWIYTAPTEAHPEGVRSVAKKNLKPGQFKSPLLASALGYRNRLVQCLNTFMRPWLEQASISGGTIHPRWNQTRNPEDKGTRTGRPSVTKPNLLNLTKDYADKNDGYAHPAFLKLRPLPLIRQYVLPDEGCIFVHRDFNQQEFRLTAHFEAGRLMEAYNANALLDMHDFVKGEVKRVASLDLGRRPIKIANFLMLYGGGIPKLMEQLGCSEQEARIIKAAQAKALPDVMELNNSLKRLFRSNDYIRTWGGRQYHCEPASNGRTYEYKALNYLIQGSAADVTKQAVINYHRNKQHGRFLVTVYDEINLSVPAEHVAEEMEILRDAMESIPMDVPMKSDAKTGLSWSSLEKYNDVVQQSAAA